MSEKATVDDLKQEVTQYEIALAISETRREKAKRERDALEEQLKESLADRVAGAAAHQLCSQARNDLRAKLAEAERPRNDIQTCGHPRSAIAGGPTTWWCRMCDGRMADE